MQSLNVKALSTSKKPILQQLGQQLPFSNLFSVSPHLDLFGTFKTILTKCRNRCIIDFNFIPYYSIFLIIPDIRCVS